MLTEEQIKQNDHISTEEINRDIEDTKREINQMEEELSIFKKDYTRNRLDIMKREVGITNRTEFIKKLESILEYRKKNNYETNTIYGNSNM